MPIFDNGQMGYMPGESYGIPQQSQGGFGGLLSDRMNDPLLQIGLGILANNNSRNFGQVVGRGALAGIQNVQQAQQFAQQKKLQDQQMKEYQRKQQEYDRQQKALEAFKVKFPEYSEAVELDPKLAIKAAYPNLASNSADPYYTPIATAGGLGSFNNRSGQFVMIQGANGQPVVKSADSPEVRGAVKAAEAQAGASYKPNTDIPGVISTDAQVAQQAYGNQPMPFSQIPANVPRLPTQGAPAQATPQSMQILPQVQSQRDNVRLNILMQEQQNGGGAGANPELDKEIANMTGTRPQVSSLGGIKVPTPAEQAATKKAAEMKAESTAQTQIDLPTITANAQNASRQIDELIGSRDGKIKPHAGFEAAVGMSSKFDPRNYLAGTEATNFNTRLDQLKGGQFLQAFNSLKGGGAITEIEGRKATDAIARMNSAQTEEEFIKSARDYQDVIDSGLKRQQAKAGIASQGGGQAKQGATLPAKPSALTLKKGTVYSTPKGNLTWNGKAFED